MINSRNRRRTGTVLAIGGLATVAALLSPGLAAAAPMDMVAPLLDSTCTFDQVDRALHAKNPQLASILDQNPSQKAQLRAKFNEPIQQRHAEAQQYLAQHPEMQQQAQNDPRASGLSKTIQAVADSCHNY
ncbi:hemophore-related protein [Nocardia macrotermitis]|uniref:Hemophore-related protein n=1 Tax=Nocardia macrotermitis TaxID=2585198 RepID=A0A7K0D0L5_9NOCA|nr:hemophore-related protein [Nocardia macrotermitis]MQY19276.1 hypothetical protein [Nocardia macrotermitis]